MSDASLENFLSRPIKIASYSWAVGSNIFESFNPWTLFFTNSRVINRIVNFNLLRCNLKVRIVINGNGFYYGRALASYNPLYVNDSFTRIREFFPQDNIAASQRPHVYLDPTQSQGGTLTLPFVWYKNALNIPNEEWTQMGEMVISTLVGLKHANGATGPITVSVFAWAEDVNLSIPTSNEPGALSPQMGEIFDPQATDEYGTGPVSRPANVLAAASGALSKIPVIGPYMRATEMAANAVSSIATMFGYSRPVELAPVEPYRPTYLGNMTNTNVSDSCTKLTFDCKQELTVDNRVCGLGPADEMTVASIATRESFLTTFVWTEAASPETLLWNSHVNPVLWDTATSGAITEIHMPACCYAVQPFDRWKGTMKFRFQVSASSFHKGRLKVSYDPSFFRSNEYNTNYTHIIDLAKERDFTVEIGWGQERALCNHLKPGLSGLPFSSTLIGSVPGSFANGLIAVHVVNDLTVPNSVVNNDVTVAVFVSMEDDVEVFDPDSANLEDYTWFAPQMAEVFDPQMAETDMSQPDSDLTLEESEPMKMETTASMASTDVKMPAMHSVYYGDPIVSFRNCLKRYGYVTALTPTAGVKSYNTWILSDFPGYRGYAPGAMHLTSVPAADTPYNYCKMTLLNWITPGFECMRGGLRWKYLRTGGNIDENDMMIVGRKPSTASGYALTTDNCLTRSTGSSSEIIRQNAIVSTHMWDGAHATSVYQNPAIEVEIPFYSNIRFFPAKIADKTGVNAFNSYHSLQTIWSANSTDTPLIHCMCSVGEDFNLGFFTGAPVAFYVPQVSEPAAQT